MNSPVNLMVKPLMKDLSLQWLRRHSHPSSIRCVVGSILRVPRVGKTEQGGFMRFFRNVAAVCLFVAAMSVGTTARGDAPPWVTTYCGGQQMQWGLEYFTNDCTDDLEFCIGYCGEVPYGYWCSSYGDGRTDGGCWCVAVCG